MKSITRDEIKAKMDGGDGLLLVETLDEEYYRQAHLPGAVNLPNERLGQLAPDLLPDKDAEVVVYCMSSL